MSLTQEEINFYQKARRGKGDLVIVDGFHALKHGLRFDAVIEKIYMREGVDLSQLGETVVDQAVVDKVASGAVTLNEDAFEKLTTAHVRTGVTAVMRKPGYSLEDIIDRPGSKVILEHPRDLDNVGACIRVAAAADCAALLVVGDMNPWHVRAIRAAAGCQWALPVLQVSEVEFDCIIKKYITYACTDEGGTVYDVPLENDAFYIFGTERDGITQAVRERATKKISLPMRAGVASLNLATSVSGILYAQKNDQLQ